MKPTPVITIFVRHGPGCKYVGDEFCKRCRCRKHLRWTASGKQFRRKAGTRSWPEAEEVKRALEAQLTGRPQQIDEAETGRTIADAVKTFLANKKAQGIKPKVQDFYRRELERLQKFSEGHGVFTIAEALTVENLTGLRATWPKVFPSSYSRSVVQKHISHFARFCYNSGWIERVPNLPTIKVESPETLPLTDAEYKSLLAAAEDTKTSTLIQLMRWSGLAIRDASTLKRSDLHFRDGVNAIIRDRTKTGAALYIPIPPDVAASLLAVLNGNSVYVFWNRKKETASEYRHASKMGEAVAAAFEAAGIESEGHMISHRLRATYAVDLLQKGVALEHVSKLLGHKSIVTTERHYAKWVKGRQDRLDKLVTESWAQK